MSRSRSDPSGGGRCRGLTRLGLVIATAALLLLASASPAVAFEFLTKWGTTGSGDGQFNGPIGVAADPAGNVYVADTNNNRIEKFTSSGAFLTKWGTLGSGDGQFRQPFGVAVDAAGNVYVTDRLNNRIQKFTSAGDLLTNWRTTGPADRQFNQPDGVTP